MTLFQQRLTRLKEKNFSIILIHGEEILAQGMHPVHQQEMFLAEAADGQQDHPIVQVDPGLATALFEFPTAFSAEFKRKVAQLFILATRATTTRRYFARVFTTKEIHFTDAGWNELGYRAREAYLAWNCADNQVLKELGEIRCTTLQIPIDILPEIEAMTANHKMQQEAQADQVIPFIAPPPPKVPRRRRRTALSEPALEPTENSQTIAA